MTGVRTVRWGQVVRFERDGEQHTATVQYVWHEQINNDPTVTMVTVYYGGGTLNIPLADLLPEEVDNG